MKIVDLYSKLKAASQTHSSGYSLYQEDPELTFLQGLAQNWEMSVEAARDWFASPEGRAQIQIAQAYLKSAPQIVKHVETTLGKELPGVLILAPSFGEFDGFARYDHGNHNVLLGIDFPDADLAYLKALTAHELSHVFRDHSPEVWAHLEKPLHKVSRSEYLEATTAQEHLVSEGLATLFSSALFPEIPSVVHHFYEEAEWQWCNENWDKIKASLRACLKGDEDVWSYYSSARVAKGSPSRTQYFYAARILAERLDDEGLDVLKRIIEMHQLPASAFEEFKP